MTDNRPSNYRRKGRTLTMAEHAVVYDRQLRYIKGRDARKAKRARGNK